MNQRHGNQQPLALAAGELVGQVVEAALRLRQRHLVERGNHPPPHLPRDIDGAWTRSASAICLPTGITGFSAVMGS